MGIELFLAKRILFGVRNGSKGAPPASRIALLGIILGLAVMILSVAIVIGFKKEVRNKVIGFGSHIQITNFDNNSSYESQPIVVSDSLLRDIIETPGIRQADRFATKPGILKTDDDFEGIVLKGVDSIYDWSFFKSYLLKGDLPDINKTEGSPDILLSRFLADRLNLNVGDKINAYFVQDQVRARRFSISGIYETGFTDYDRIFLITGIRQVQRLNDWDKDHISGVEIMVDDYRQLDALTDTLYFRFASLEETGDDTFLVRSIKEIVPQIFSWLDLLDINVAVILLLMISVSGFTMISGLLILILERTNMIGILKALGENDTSIRKIFLYLSFFLIGRGMLWGNVIGISICLLQKYFHIIKLDASVYYLSAVPIDIDPVAIVLLNLGTLVITMLLMIAPSYLITKIAPVKAIRFE
ncbi:MAG: ABC transporter permease [Bacteroidales bacterium]|nr:ABC transporter permease [Bacteroidales bacterium]